MNQAVVVAHLLTVVVVGRSLRRCLKLQRLKTITVNVVLSHVGFLRNGAAVIAFRLKGSVCVCWSVTVSQSVTCFQAAIIVFSLIRFRRRLGVVVFAHAAVNPNPLQLLAIIAVTPTRAP